MAKRLNQTSVKTHNRAGFKTFFLLKIKLDWIQTPAWLRMTSVDVTSSVEMLENAMGERFGKRRVITEYADLLVISSSLFLALRSDSLASCRSCFSWSASFALWRIDTWVTHSRFEHFEVDTVLGSPKHKFSWKWKNGCSDQQKIETFTGTKSNSYAKMHINRVPHTK